MSDTVAKREMSLEEWVNSLPKVTGATEVTHRAAREYRRLKTINAELLAALEAACHAAGIVGKYISVPTHKVDELEWAPKARGAIAKAKETPQ